MPNETNGNDRVYGDGYLTIRELFAAMAMQGLSTVVRLKTADIARYAVETADALIAELNKEQTI
jgi:hypothetical protein